jgi:hypothetical protein
MCVAFAGWIGADSVQTLNKFAKNNELEKIKLYISMGANPDRCGQTILPEPDPPVSAVPHSHRSVKCAEALSVSTSESADKQR